MIIRNYFVKYDAGEQQPPYELSSELRESLLSIDGLQIPDNLNLPRSEPLLIVTMPGNKEDEVRSLEGVLYVEQGQQYSPLLK